MASNWLYIDTNFPTFTGEESPDEKIRTIQDYLFLLVEQLRYSLHNLDLSNMNAAAVEAFTGTLTEPIYAMLQDEENNLAQLALTAQGLSTRMTDAEGNIGTVTLTANSLVSRLDSFDGGSSSLEQTVSGLTSRVSTAEGNISTVTQTVNGLSSTVSNHTGSISALQQTVNGFTLSVSNGSDSSTISLKSGNTTISSQTISMSGMVTFTDLSTSGSTQINGGNLTTGRINADNVSVNNAFSVYHNNTSYGIMGYAVGRSGNSYTYGIGIADATGKNYFIATNAGARITALDSNNVAHSVYVTDDGCYATHDPLLSSDRRVKRDIRYDLMRYEDFFNRLRPCRYQRIDEATESYHIGYVAQEVEDALCLSGLTNEDFAGLFIGERYHLRYNQFTALNTYMIQALQRRIEALEARI